MSSCSLYTAIVCAPGYVMAPPLPRGRRPLSARADFMHQFDYPSLPPLPQREIDFPFFDSSLEEAIPVVRRWPGCFRMFAPR